MKIKYNAPAVLSFAFLCAAMLLLNQLLFHNLIRYWFLAPGRGGFNAGSLRSWLTLVTHVAGHASWEHLIGNLLLLLVVGPMLEDSFGTWRLLFMMFVTALVTGAANVLFFRTALLGASGIVFMFILLASFTNFRTGELPLTFILVLLLYIGREFIASFGADNTAQFAHIIGGFCGSVFGFLKPSAKIAAA